MSAKLREQGPLPEEKKNPPLLCENTAQKTLLNHRKKLVDVNSTQNID